MCCVVPVRAGVNGKLFDSDPFGNCAEQGKQHTNIFSALHFHISLPATPPHSDTEQVVHDSVHARSYSLCLCVFVSRLEIFHRLRLMGSKCQEIQRRQRIAYQNT